MEDRPKHDFSGPEICAYPARKVVAMLKKGEVSPKELLDAAYERITTVEPSVNAMPILCEERARAFIAKLADKLELNGSQPGWLAGLPIGIKDLNDVEGVHTTYGSVGFKDNIATASSHLIGRLEDRGGI